MYTIPTLDDLRRQLGLAANDTDSDEDLLHRLQDASYLIESLTQRRYCPLRQTRTVPRDQADKRYLILPDDLLELIAIRDAGGAIDPQDVQPLPDIQNAPASILQLVNGETFQPGTGAAHAITIDGIWGWHDRWAQAWTDSGDTVDNNTLSADATTISVNDSAGSDAAGFSPRFQIGHLLRIADEYLRVTGIDRQNHRLTVNRGAQGTAAATHRRGDSIETYTASLPIRDLTLRYAELMLKSPGPLAHEPSSLLIRMRRLTV